MPRRLVSPSGYSTVLTAPVYSLLNVLSLYHDSILHRSLASLPPSARPAPSSHARYTRFWTSTSPTYAALARTLTLLSYSELLIEMGIKKRLGKARAEKAVMVIELAKAFMRLLLLRETKGRMGVNPAVPEREVDPSILDQQKKLPPIVLGQPPHASVEFPRSSADVLLGVQGEEGAQQDYWVGSRTGLTRPTLASIQPPADLLLGTPSPASGKDVLHQYLLTRVLTAEDVKKPQDLVSKVHGLGRLAEIVWILRPVIYGALDLIKAQLTSACSCRDEEVRPTTHFPLSSLPFTRVPFLLASRVEQEQPALVRQGFWPDASVLDERRREGRVVQACPQVLVVLPARSRLGHLHQVSLTPLFEQY